MLAWMRRWLGVSVPDEQKKARVTVWLNAILSTLLITATFVAALFVILGEGEGLLLTVAAGIFFATLLLLVRRGFVQAASVLLVLLLLVIATLSAYTAGGINIRSSRSDE